MPSSVNVAVDFDIYDVICSPFLLGGMMSYKEEIGPGENFKLRTHRYAHHSCSTTTSTQIKSVDDLPRNYSLFMSHLDCTKKVRHWLPCQLMTRTWNWSMSISKPETPCSQLLNPRASYCFCLWELLCFFFFERVHFFEQCPARWKHMASFVLSLPPS